MRGSVRVALLALLGAGVVWLAVEAAVPVLIRSAHAGRGPLVFQQMLAGRARHPAEHYVAVWRHRGRPVAWALTAAALLAVAAGSKSVRARLERALRPSEDVPAPAPPSAGRQAAVACLALTFVAGSLVELAVDPPYRGEHWPFSQYRMYSELPRRSPLRARRLFGVTAGSPALEIPLDGAYIRPFDSSRLGVSFDRLDTPGREGELEAAMGDCLRRYELRRVRGEHHGPRLQSVRLYLLTWAVDDRATSRDSPSRERIAEVRTP